VGSAYDVALGGPVENLSAGEQTLGPAERLINKKHYLVFPMAYHVSPMAYWAIGVKAAIRFLEDLWKH
jgi:hypothetical protein